MEKIGREKCADGLVKERLETEREAGLKGSVKLLSNKLHFYISPMFHSTHRNRGNTSRRVERKVGGNK